MGKCVILVEWGYVTCIFVRNRIVLDIMYINLCFRFEKEMFIIEGIDSVVKGNIRLLMISI